MYNAYVPLFAFTVSPVLQLFTLFSPHATILPSISKMIFFYFRVVGGSQQTEGPGGRG